MFRVQAATHAGLAATIGIRINRKSIQTTAQVTWALYKRAELDRLLKSIDDSIDFLESLIPAMVGAARDPNTTADARNGETETVENQIMQELAEKELVNIQETISADQGIYIIPLQVVETLQEATSGPESPDLYL